MDSAALVLHSGGLDSTVCLLWALERYERVETVTFSYGQPNRVEIECARCFVEELPHLFPPARGRPILRHDITLQGVYSPDALAEKFTVTLHENLPRDQFDIPVRTYAFLAAALALQKQRAIPAIVSGVMATETRAFPDCATPFFGDIERLVQKHFLSGYRIRAPLSEMEKREVWAYLFANWNLTVCDLVIERTQSCFRGDRERRHPWGYGCGMCASCRNRADGWLAYKSARG